MGIYIQLIIYNRGGERKAETQGVRTGKQKLQRGIGRGADAAGEGEAQGSWRGKCGRGASTSKGETP